MFFRVFFITDRNLLISPQVYRDHVKILLCFLRDLSLLESQGNDISGPLPWSIGAEQWKLGVQLQLWNRLGADGNLELLGRQDHQIQSWQRSSP